MEVLYLCYDSILEPIGKSQILFYLKELSKRGFNFTLISFDKKSDEVGKFNKVKNELKNCGIRWISLRYHKRPVVLSTLYDVGCGIFLSLYVVMARQIKIVHARSYVVALIAIILKKMFGIKFVFDMRGFWPDERYEAGIWKRKGFLYYFTKFLEKKYLNCADEVVVLTKRAKETLESSFNIRSDKILVIPCCVDADIFKFNIEWRNRLRERLGIAHKFVFIYSGSLEDWYMKEEMLEYFRVAKEFIPKIHFLILSNFGIEKLDSLISKKGLTESDFTLLSAEFNQMPQYISLADVGIFFITPTSSKMASCPTKFAEYLSCGLPVICNKNIGDLEEYINKNRIGVVINNFTKNDYKMSISKLLDLLEEKTLKERCRNAAINGFSLTSGVNKYRGIYQSLMTKAI